MKTLVLSVALFLSATAFGSNDVLFKIEKPKFHKEHIKGTFASGSMLVSYEQSFVRMTLERAMPRCPVGAMCAMVMPAPVVVELPITSVEVDHCGVKTVVAQTDMRPADGLLNKIELVDATDLNGRCHFIAPVEQKASYTVEYYDQINGKAVKQVSKMTLSSLQQPRKQDRTYVMAEGKLEFFPQLEIPEYGSLVFNDKEVLLHVAIGLDCAPNAPCPAYMPAAISTLLKVVSVKKSSCGDVYIAKKIQRLVNGILVEEVKVTDYSNALCEIYLPHVVLAEYTEKRVHSLGATILKKGNFSFDLQQ